MTIPSGASAEPQNGAAWAALLSAGVGGLVFGILTDISEVSTGASKYLQKAYAASGSLSGVAVCSVLIWIGVWAALHFRWRHRRIQRQQTLLVAIILLALAGLITTFPPFYEMIGG